jgi:hypothetical protein
MKAFDRHFQIVEEQLNKMKKRRINTERKGTACFSHAAPLLL